MTNRHLIAVEPHTTPAWVADTVREAGASISTASEAYGLVWGEFDSPAELSSVLARNPQIQWIHLLYSGIDPYLDVLEPSRHWTSGKSTLARPVAEHALALALAATHELTLSPVDGRDRQRHTTTQPLYGRNVLIVGAGAIAGRLIELLGPFECDIWVVRKRPEPVAAASRTLAASEIAIGLQWADVVVLTLALTPETDGMIGPTELGVMKPSASLVNVARGRHIDTDALLAALDRGELAFAALDVTDPEPLPVNHGLLKHPRCLVTPHIAATGIDVARNLGERVKHNVEAFIAGLDLAGAIDLQAHY
jgi:phosphoglycerate dehydrogenase-like enzyme